MEEVTTIIDLVELLKGVEVDWSTRNDALIKLQTIIRNGELTNKSPFLQPLCTNIAIQLTERRSALINTVCSTITCLCETLKNEFEELIPDLLPPLLKLLIVTIKIIVEYGHNALCSIIKNVRPTFWFPLILEGLSHNHQNIRQRCAEYTAMILAKTNDTTELEVHIELLMDAIIKGLQDANEQARIASRKAFIRFEVLWKTHSETLFAKFDPTIQKRITADKEKGNDTTNSKPQARGNIANFRRAALEKAKETKK